MSLSINQLEQLQKAILSAFPRKQALEMMVRYKLDETLEHIAFGDTHRDLVFNLIMWAESQGKLDDLIEGAYKTNDGNPQLKEFYQAVKLRQNFIIDAPPNNTDFGPDIQWRGEEDEVQLESWLKPKPDYLDVGFLQRTLAQSSAVCRIEIPNRQSTATGVLITPDQVLTNYHVLQPNEENDLTTNALNAVLKFGCLSADDGLESVSKSFQLDRQKPILHFSKTENLDYVLLQVEPSIKQATEIQPARWDGNKLPRVKMGISLLQHPEGESMKLSVSQDGITGVYEDSGLVQYVNKTAQGSSGSPCFDEDCYFVALHHAEMSRSFGRIREGILFTAIYREIKDYLS
jgi:V8-like Glu-specific endopeptidase